MPAKKHIKKIWDFFFIPLRILDGDSVVAFIDRGGNDWHKGRIRLALINSDELELKDSKGKIVPNPSGIAAKEHLEKLLEGWMGTGNIETDKRMYMNSLKFDLYDRYVGMVYFDINDRDDPYYSINEKVAAGGKSINAMMVKDGYAKYQNY